MPSKKRHNTVSTFLLFRVIVILTGVIYGTIHHYNKALIPEDLNTALTITLLLLLVEQFLEIGHVLHSTAREDRGIESKVRQYIHEDHGILGDLLNKMHDELSNTIRFPGEGFTLFNPAVAIYSYVEFWDLLTEEQRIRGDAKPLNVEAVHSCAMDIWATHPLAARLLDRQKEFHRLGGRIVRILCGRGPQPSEQLRKAANNMLAAGIDVKYYDIMTDLVDHTFGWDFLRVREFRQSVIWDSFAAAPGAVISEAVYLDSPIYKGKNLDNLWLDVLNHSEPLTVAPNSTTTSGHKGRQ